MQRNQSENARQGARYDGIDEIEPNFAGAGVRVGIVMARFAEHIKSIGHLNITPDLLAQHFREWLGNPPDAT